MKLYFSLGVSTSKSTIQVESFPDLSAVSEGDLNIPVFSEAFQHYNKGKFEGFHYITADQDPALSIESDQSICVHKSNFLQLM